MAEFFNMPKLGMDMEEGTVINWLKKEGETLKKGEALAEIETDKSSVEVESPADGILLKIYHEEGEALPCGTPLAFIGAEGDAIPTPETPTANDEAPPQQEEKEENISSPAPVSLVSTTERSFPTAPIGNAALTEGGRIRSSPRARRLAAKNGIDLRLITGSGDQGRIIEADVRQFMAMGNVAISTARRIPTDTLIPLNGVRKVTARRMKQSLSTTAQANHRVEVNMSNLITFRAQINQKLEAEGIKISVLDILLGCCAKALTENPMANSALLEDGIHQYNFANIGIAADTEKGLVVPVLKDADVLSLKAIARERGKLIDKARQGALKPEDMQGGTFTISNLGMFEIDSFTAVLNPPETCILAVGRTRDCVVAENGAAVIRPMMSLSLTYDHQVLDGAPAARFLETIKHYIENPVWILL